MVQMMTNDKDIVVIEPTKPVVYTVSRYSSLEPFIFGHQWHLRVLNKQMDFCYIIKETVQFCLHRRLDIEDPVDDTRTVRGGYVLIFRFVRGDGVRRDWNDIVSLHER